MLETIAIVMIVAAVVSLVTSLLGGDRAAPAPVPVRVSEPEDYRRAGR